MVTRSQNDHLNIVELLLERGARIGVKDNAGETAQAKAEKKGYRQVVALLEAWQDKNK